MRTVSLRVVMIMMLAMFCSLQGFAGGGTTNSTYYSKATAIAPSGKGTVYVSKKNPDDGAKYAEESSATNSSIASSAPKHTYYMFAKAADGFSFAGWATIENGNATVTDNPYTYQVNASSTTQGSPTEGTLYAIFAESQTFYSTITVNATEGGKVFVATAETANPEYAATATASQNTEGAGSASHNYNLYAQAEDGYEFAGWALTADGAIISDSKAIPYVAKVTTSSTDSEAPQAATYYAKFVAATPHYSRVKIGLNAANDLGTQKIGGKVYVGKTAEEAASCVYEYTSEASIMSYSVGDASHEYYLYAEPEDGFTFAGWQTSQTQISTSYNSTANPYLYKVQATSTDSENPTEKVMYARFNYIEKPAKVYAAGVVQAVIIEEDGTTRVDAQNSGCMVGITDEASATTCSTWAEDFIQGATQEGDTPASASTTTYIHFTAFAKAGSGYEFKGFTSSRTGNPTETTIAQGETGYYSTSNTRQSFSNTANTPGAMGLEDAPKQKIVYAIFQKLAVMDEPTGETAVAVTEVKGTTSLVEGSVAKDFTVDLVLNEYVPYDKPGSDKNAKPNEVLKQFVTVLGANGNKASVTNYSLVSESKDLGEDGNGLSLGTAYTCHTLRLSFPYNIKADTYTVHLPYGLYTTVDGNKTPTYEFTITVTEDTNPYLTVKSTFPTKGMTIKYKAASQTSTPDASKGEFEKSNVTAAIEFNEVVVSIDETKKDGITLVNNTNSVNYKPTNVIRNAAMLSKVDGNVSIAYPELVNGSYTLTIPEGLFVGNGKVNEAMTINFTVSGFNSVQLKPYEMVTDQIAPKANDMSQKIEKLQNIEISYKGEFGDAKALVGDASGIKVRRYTEVIQGDGEGAKPVRTYYDDVTTTPSAKVQDGKLVVSFTPALTTGMYEVTVPAGMAANMEPGEMTMAQKVNAGYAETPAYSMTFNVETPEPTSGTINLVAQGVLPGMPDMMAGFEVYYATFSSDKDVIISSSENFGLLSVTPVTLVKDEGEDKYAIYTPSVEESSEIAVTDKTVKTADGFFVPAGSGVLIVSMDHEAKYYYVAEDNTAEPEAFDPAGTNMLRAASVEKETDGSYKFYMLAYSDSQKTPASLGFYWGAANGGVFNSREGSAYLAVPASQSNVKGFAFSSIADAIQNVEAVKGNDVIYNLQGQRVDKAQRGLYIVNGKKVVK